MPNFISEDDIEQALDTAVLTVSAVQRIEDDVGLRIEPRQQLPHVALHIDRGDNEAGALEGICAGGTGNQ